MGWKRQRHKAIGFPKEEDTLSGVLKQFSGMGLGGIVIITLGTTGTLQNKNKGAVEHKFSELYLYVSSVIYELKS